MLLALRVENVMYTRMGCWGRVLYVLAGVMYLELLTESALY